MNASQFDPIARRIGTPVSRRTAMGAAGAWLATGAFGNATAAQGTPASPAPDTGGTIEVSGEVASPGPLTLADIQALPAETVDVTYLMLDGTEVEHSYTGARFWDVLQLAEPLVDPERPETSLHMYVVLTAKDGYVVVLSMGEIDPEFGGHPYLLAWDEDGQAFSGERGPVMLVPPGDRTEGRYIWGVVSIEVRSVDVETGT
jgi:DMSO/TMAO reductase YedYZ molybdopterin-dependent catalytic subunit